MNWLRIYFCSLIFITVSSVDVAPIHGQQPFINQVPELKADSLVLFGYYFKWPANVVPGNSFVIGLLGDAPFTSQRVTARFGKIGNKQIRVLEFDSAKDYEPCHILFVADAARVSSVEKTPRDRLAAAVKQINGRPVLVVAESQGFAERGAMINFVVDRRANRLKTEVNLTAVKKAKLSVTKHFVTYAQTDKYIPVEQNQDGAREGAR